MKPISSDRTPSAEDGFSERALVQRERILLAAERCFVRSGFHAASMSEIASTARMSPGLIYRYFESKNAIIMAIIERQLADSSRRIEQQAQDDLVELMMLALDHWQNREYGPFRSALFLEMAAEASRHEDIARTLQAADEIIRERVQQALKRDAARRGCALGDDQLRAHTLLLQCLIEGLAVRVIREPDLNRDQVRSTLEGALSALLQHQPR